VVVVEENRGFGGRPNDEVIVLQHAPHHHNRPYPQENVFVEERRGFGGRYNEEVVIMNRNNGY
jgi:hypothetical protein